jgi:hypothetical protein
VLCYRKQYYPFASRTLLLRGLTSPITCYFLSSSQLTLHLTWFETQSPVQFQKTYKDVSSYNIIRATWWQREGICASPRRRDYLH